MTITTLIKSHDYVPGLPRTFWGGGCPDVKMLLGCSGFGGVWELPVDEEEEFDVKIAAGAELMDWEEERTDDFTTTWKDGVTHIPSKAEQNCNKLMNTVNNACLLWVTVGSDTLLWWPGTRTSFLNGLQNMSKFNRISNLDLL